MKKMIILAFTMLLICGVWAQDGTRQRREFKPEDMAQRRTENLEKKLGLDSIQSKKIYALYLEEANAMKTRMENRGNGERPSDADREKMQEEMKKRQEAMDGKMKAILTEEQFKEYSKMDRRGFGGGRGQRGGGNR